MRFAPLIAAFAAAATLVGFSTLSGQPPAGKEKKADPDLAALQGEWVITKVVPPPGEQGPPEAILGQVKLTLKGSILTAEFPAGKGFGPKADAIHGLIVLDSSKTPRHIDLTQVDKTGQPARRTEYIATKSTAGGGVSASKKIDRGPYQPVKGIYKVDGDTLIACFPDLEVGARPKAFKAAAQTKATVREVDPAYFLVHLARKK